jgi:ABC-type multidrug transport system fused ATPase/permease subunit
MAHHGPEDVFIAVMTLLGAFGVMLYIHPTLAVLTFLVVPVLTWLGIYFNQRMTGAFRNMYSDIADYNARVEDNIGGIRVVQAFANEDHERKLFAQENEKYRTLKIEAYGLMSKGRSLSYMTTRIVQILIMIAGAYFVLHNDMTVGGFMGFLLLVNVFFRPVESISQVMETYPKGYAGFQRYTELLDIDPDIADAHLAACNLGVGPDAAVLAGEHRHRDVRREAHAFPAGDADHPLDGDAGGLHHADGLVAADERRPGPGHDPLGPGKVIEVGVPDDDPVALVDVVGAQTGAGGARRPVDVRVEEDRQVRRAQAERRASVPVERGHDRQRIRRRPATRTGRRPTVVS